MQTPNDIFDVERAKAQDWINQHFDGAGGTGLFHGKFWDEKSDYCLELRIDGEVLYKSPPGTSCHCDNLMTLVSNDFAGKPWFTGEIQDEFIKFAAVRATHYLLASHQRSKTDVMDFPDSDLASK